MEYESEKVSRLKSCPSKLESLLKAMRTVPPDPRLTPFEEALTGINIDFPAAPSFEREEKALEYCLELLKQEVGSVSEFRDYVWQPRHSRHQDPSQAVQEAIDRYEGFRITREKLTWLAKLSKFPVETRRGMRQLLRSLDIEIDEQGEVQAREDWFIKAVTGVEAGRIRECQLCARIFWAGRLSVWGCSPRCLDILRKRNKRKRDAKDKLDMQRPERLSPDETEKRDLIRQALKPGGLDQSQIAEQTKLTADEVGDVLSYLILDSGEVHFNQKDETRIYFLKQTQAKMVKSRHDETKRR